MAEKTPAPAADAPAASPGKSKQKLVILISVAVVALLAGGGALAFVLMGKKPAAEAAAQAGKPAEDGATREAGGPRKMPVFVELDTFTVNLRDKEGDKDGERFLQVKLVMEVKDTPGGEMLKTLMPSVRNEILLLLGSKNAAQLGSREGKEELAKELVAAANRPLKGTPQSGTVEGVNFTHLIIQ